MAQQEPFNEVVASLVCSKLNIPHVEYQLMWEAEKPYSVCPNMTNDREDLVSAYYIFSAFPLENGVSAYEHFLNCCERLGIPDAQKHLQQMIILDYLICNQDRHFGNFGAIRDSVTLEWKGLAPIYDSGTSLWFDQYASKIDALADAQAKPFAYTHEQQIQLSLPEIHNINLDMLSGINTEVREIFDEAKFGEPGRAEILSAALAERCEHLQKLEKA